MERQTVFLVPVSALRQIIKGRQNGKQTRLRAVIPPCGNEIIFYALVAAGAHGCGSEPQRKGVDRRPADPFPRSAGKFDLIAQQKMAVEHFGEMAVIGAVIIPD